MGKMANTSVNLGQRAPAARSTGLVITEAAEEVLVYDTERHHIHHLNRTSAVIWRLLDGQRTADEIARLAAIELESAVDALSVRTALTTLSDADLLDGDLSADQRVLGQSRRRFLRKAAIAGAAVPVIASITAPSALAQISCTTPSTGCANNNDCPPGCQCNGSGNPAGRTCGLAP
jgi:hypothetical protein